MEDPKFMEDPNQDMVGEEEATVEAQEEPEADQLSLDEQRRQAEIAEGQRQAKLHAKDPFIPHPSQELQLDAEAALRDQRLRQAQQALDEQRATESEAARINREIFEKIYAARNQPPPPPPKPQPVPQAIQNRTLQEMQAGRDATARHVQQRLTAQPRTPTPKEIAAQGTTREVFNPNVVIRAEVVPDRVGNWGMPGRSTNDAKRGARQLS